MTPLRRSSRCTLAQSGTGRAPRAGAGLGEQHARPKRRRPGLPGRGQVIPASRIRLTCSARVVGGTPRLAETWRRLKPSARVNRITSLILRMAMWGRGTGTSSGVVVDYPRQGAGPFDQLMPALHAPSARCTETTGTVTYGELVGGTVKRPGRDNCRGGASMSFPSVARSSMRPIEPTLKASASAAFSQAASTLSAPHFLTGPRRAYTWRIFRHGKGSSRMTFA